jgi:hypothetical protein
LRQPFAWGVQAAANRILHAAHTVAVSGASAHTLLLRQVVELVRTQRGGQAAAVTPAAQRAVLRALCSPLCQVCGG